MARSPTHEFGQIVGHLVEEAMLEPLAEIAARHGLYLDRRSARPARGGSRKVSWADDRGNRHDLDYVLERGGSDDVVGRPAAFVEIAYRRYTKHSRNKAQEMQGAVVPLAEKWREEHPFLGVVLAGEFTSGSIAQLRSHGFGVVHFPFEDVVAAFRAADVDAYFDEATSDEDVAEKVAACRDLDAAARRRIARRLRRSRKPELATFLAELETSLTRSVESIVVLGLHGRTTETPGVAAAIAAILAYDESVAPTTFCRYEVQVRYTNCDTIRATFAAKTEAVRFLEGLR